MEAQDFNVKPHDLASGLVLILGSSGGEYQHPSYGAFLRLMRPDFSADVITLPADDLAPDLGLISCPVKSAYRIDRSRTSEKPLAGWGLLVDFL